MFSLATYRIQRGLTEQCTTISNFWLSLRFAPPKQRRQWRHCRKGFRAIFPVSPKNICWYLKFLSKMPIILFFRKRFLVFFSNFSYYQKSTSHLPVSFFEVLFWLGLPARTTTNHHKYQKKSVIIAFEKQGLGKIMHFFRNLKNSTWVFMLKRLPIAYFRLYYLKGREKSYKKKSQNFR